MVTSKGRHGGLMVSMLVFWFSGQRGCTQSIHYGQGEGLMELYIATPPPQKKYMTLKFYTQNYLASKFSTWKNKDLKYLNTGLLNQTLRPKKICDKSLHLKNKTKTEHVNFQPKEIHQTPHHVYCEYSPWVQQLGFEAFPGYCVLFLDNTLVTIEIITLCRCINCTIGSEIVTS